MNPEDVKILISLRLQQAEECLNVAQTLLSIGKGNLTIINRSYYAAFYSILALLQTIGKIPQKHRGAISLFDTEFIKTGILPKELSNSLHWLFNERNKDDYINMEPISVEDSQKALEKAEHFVEAVKSYLVKAGFLSHPT